MKKKKALPIFAVLIVTMLLSVFVMGACTDPEEDVLPPSPGEDGLVSISVFKSPSKTEYYIGEVFDPSGMVLKATYDDGRTVNLLYEDCEYSVDPLGTDNTEIVITFGSQSVAVPIRVIARPTGSTLTGITVVTPPTKTEYVRGEVFNPDGLVLHAVYDDSSAFAVDLSEVEYSLEPLTLDDTQILLSYMGFSTAVDISVSRYSIRVYSDEHRTYRMEAEATDLSTIKLTGWAEGKNIVESNAAASGGAVLANLSAAEGYVEYGIYSEIEGKVTLYITCALGKEAGVIAVDSAFTATWNEEPFITNATMVGTSWSNDFRSVELGTVMLQKGDNTFRLTRKGTCPNFDCVDFEVNRPAVREIEVTDLPEKTAYYVGDTFDPTGMTVRATYEDGSTEEVEISKLSYNTSPLTLDDTAVTISYDNATATVDITVSALAVTGISVVTMPTKTAYVRGETFSSFGLVVSAEYANGTTKNVPVSALTFDKTTLAETDTEVTVTYEGFSATIPVTVSKYSIRITDDEHQTYRMEAEAADLSTIKLTGWAEGKNIVESNAAASGGAVLANLSSAEGYVEYGIYSEVDTKVTLYIVVACGYNNVTASTAYTLSWNGYALNSDTDIENQGWNVMQKIEIGCVPVKQGENTLRLSPKGALSCNFDCVDFEVNNPDADINDGCAVFGVSDTSVTVEAERCAIEGTPANGEGKQFVASGATYVENLGKAGNTVTVTIYAQQATAVSLSMFTCQAYGQTLDFASTFTMEVNGTTVNVSAEIAPSENWSTFIETPIGSMNLQQGFNTVVFTVKAAKVPNLDKFVFTKA